MPSPRGSGAPRGWSYADAARGHKAPAEKPQKGEKSLSSPSQTSQPGTGAPSTPTNTSLTGSTTPKRTQIPASESSTGSLNQVTPTPKPKFSYAAAVRGKQSGLSPMAKKSNKPAKETARKPADLSPSPHAANVSPALGSGSGKQVESARNLQPIHNDGDRVGTTGPSTVDLDRALMPPPPLPVRNVAGDRRKSVSEPSPKDGSSKPQIPTGPRNATPKHQQVSTSPIGGEGTSDSTLQSGAVGTSSSAQSGPSSEGDGQQQFGDAVENRINSVIDAERQRVEDLEIWKNHLALLMHRHDTGVLNLWEKPINWDVQVECNGQKWQLHWCMLTREHSRFKTMYLPPSHPQLWTFFTVNLDKHQPQLVSVVLHYMYHKTFPDAHLTAEESMKGEVIRRNAYMYICAASVDYTRLMDVASSNLNEAATVLSKFAEAEMKDPKPRPDLNFFLMPLRVALLMVFEQGARHGMMSLRVGIARVMNAILPWLWTQQYFLDLSKDENWKGLMANVHEDIAMAAQYGFLTPYTLNERTHPAWKGAREALDDPLVGRVDSAGPAVTGPWAAFAAEQAAGEADGAQAPEGAPGEEKAKPATKEEAGVEAGSGERSAPPVEAPADEAAVSDGETFVGEEEELGGEDAGAGSGDPATKVIVGGEAADESDGKSDVSFRTAKESVSAASEGVEA
ncbi:hypothetical protein OQA88_1657 [Cercophora sp. LCS_1]